jgi:hypothetical protein
MDDAAGRRSPERPKVLEKTLLKPYNPAMNPANLTDLYNLTVSLVPPAILLAALAYFVRFFGKVIVDQKPFCDDRDWEIEIAGTFFLLLLVILPAVLGAAAASSWGGFGTGHWMHLVIVLLLTSWLFMINGILTEKFYAIKLPLVNVFFMFIPQKDREATKKDMLAFNRFLPLYVFSFIFASVFSLEYHSGSVVWIIVMGILLFLSFVLMALDFSLLKERLPQVDIFFTDKDEQPIRDATLLKINRDNVRIMEKETKQVIILNKDQIRRIEYFPPKELQG